MSDWVPKALRECQMHDMRHAKRLATLLTQLSKSPVSSTPSACQGETKMVATYPSNGDKQIHLAMA